MSNLQIADRIFTSRLFLGTGKFGSMSKMSEAVKASESELVTMALKRVNHQSDSDELLSALHIPGVHLLPNTSGARNAQEAVLAAQLAREALETNWLKLEIHPDPRYLLPDPIETLKATEQLAKLGFIIMPYIHADPVLCKRLEDAGTAVVMPLGAPIGSNKGLRTLDFLEIIIEQSNVPVVVDAGIGAPSDAAKAMEMGADAVLVNTAIAVAGDPVQMAIAFREAVIAGRRGYEAGLGAMHSGAVASSPLTSFL
ncbi:TPA: thiazole synthase [Elizabethkingia meningoseptica]